MSGRAADPVAPEPRPAERLLRFTLSEGAWGIPLDRVGGVARCERLYPVPGAPPVVLGLAVWQGTAVAVLDCARLLGERPLAEDACLVLFAPPLESTALFVSSRIELTHVDSPPSDDPGRVRVNGEVVRLVDPVALLRSVEEELRER